MSNEFCPKDCGNLKGTPVEELCTGCYYDGAVSRSDEFRIGGETKTAKFSTGEWIYDTEGVGHFKKAVKFAKFGKR